MARVLRRTVITGGVTYRAGTAETAELAEKIPNPRAWEGEPDSEQAAATESAPRKRAARKATAKKATAAPAGDQGASNDESGASDGDSTPEGDAH